MNKEEFEKMIENVELIEVENPGHQNALRMVLLNSRRTAWYSIFLILLPTLFATANILYYELNIKIDWMVAFSDWIRSIDQTPIWNWVVRFLLLGGPFLVICLNLLSIIHFSYEKDTKELLFSIKLRWLNIGLIILCFTLLSIFAAVLVIENVNHP